MNASTKKQTETRGNSRPATAEERLKELGIKLPSPPEPFGIYAEAVQTGNLLFLTGTTARLYRVPIQTESPSALRAS